MSSATSTTASFRVFTSPSVHGGRRVAIGRNHASWFIIFAAPSGQRLRRATQCLNFVSADPQSVGHVSAAGHPCFTAGGATAARVLAALAALRDDGGLPMRVLAEEADRARLDWTALVEVGLAPGEFAHACALCGKWEAEGMPRFLPCAQ